MNSSGVPCPWEHSILFYSEDNKPKALTNRMDDLAPVGAWLLLSGTWELDASLCCVISIGLSGCSNQSPAIVLTDKAKIPAFLLLCSYYKPRITHGVVPKMKATRQESFGLDMDGTELLVGWKKGCPYLCYTVLKP